MEKFKIILLLILTSLIVTSCVTNHTEEENLADEVESNFPTPVSGKAVIFGYLLMSDNNEPVKGVPFLAQSLESDNPNLPQTISFSNQNDPGAVYDKENGFFYFEDIDPGNNYVLVLVYGPGNIEVVKEPDSELPLNISVQADETLDLGTITVQE
jgi:hypothetical protein